MVHGPRSMFCICPLTCILSYSFALSISALWLVISQQSDRPVVRFIDQSCSTVSILFGTSSRSSEGKTVEVPYRGNVHDTVRDILGGVRSTCTYVGAEKLKELPRRTTFIRVTMQLNNVFS